MKQLHKTIIKWLGIWGMVTLLLTTAGCSYRCGRDAKAQPGAPRFTQKDMGKFMASERYNEKDAAYYYRLGRHLQQRGEHGLAINEFSRAVDIDPMHAHAFNAMGVSYDRLGQFEEAKRCYLHAVKVKPDFASAYNNLGYSYLMQRKPEEAIEPLRKAVSLQRDMACFRNNLSLAYQQAGLYEEAMEDCDVAEKKMQDDRAEKMVHDELREENAPEHVTDEMIREIAPFLHTLPFLEPLERIEINHYNGDRVSDPIQVM